MDETNIPPERPKFKLPDNLIGNVFTGILDDTVATVPAIVKPRRISLEGKVGSRVDPADYRGSGHWRFVEEMGSDGYIGFIYVIVDLNNHKLYLGKKNYTTLKLIEGTTRRQKVDMNWRWYISSSKELAATVKNFGKEDFRFICIEQYKSKGALSYSETWSLMFAETPSNQHLWYNRLVNKVSWVVKEPVTERHKSRLSRIIKIMETKNVRDLEEL
jgi:hypothetical protein